MCTLDNYSYSLLRKLGCYKSRYTLPLLKCISKVEANYVLREIHEGVSGNHAGSRMLAHRAIRSDYF
jgi:hypothetical protein